MNPAWLDALWDTDGPRGWSARIVSRALIPAEALFALGIRARETLLRAGLLPSLPAPLPVISVGGLEVGGSGKTPLALELVRLAGRAGLRAAILSRGYGARGTGARSAARAVWQVPSDAGEDAALHFGDEPVWLAARAAQLGGAGVWIASRRILAARAAAEAGADLAVLDGGLQHRGLRRDGEVVCLNGSAPFGNRRMLPRGPLRESLVALQRADVVVLSAIEASRADEQAARVRSFLRPGVPVLSWSSCPALVPVRGEGPVEGEAVHLVAGIAHPERLLGSLKQLGRPLASHRFFPDHHRFRRSDLDGSSGGPGRVGATAAHARVVVTTEKDWMRLRPVVPPGARVTLLTQAIRWNEAGATSGWIEWIQHAVALAHQRITG